MKNVTSFEGIFMRNDPRLFNRKINAAKEVSGIFNMDDHSGEGTHWVAYFNDPNTNYIEYFDSFGHPPPIEIIRYLSTSAKQIVYNTNKLQLNDSNRCGWFAMKYIKDRSNGRSIHDALYQYSTPGEKNELIASQI